MSSNEVQAAHEAIDRGDIDGALHHINNLSIAGHAREVDELQRRIWQLNQRARQRNLNLQVYAFATGVLGYALLSTQSPAAWGPAVWGVIALVAIPVMVGIFAGNSLLGIEKSKRFWRSFFIAGGCIGLYTLIGMALSRSKMESADKSMDVVIFLAVMLVHSLVAGVVAGFTGTLIQIKARAI